MDLNKLSKAEAKIKAKADKRSKKTGLDLYEGSRLIDANKKQQEYEDLFMTVNPLSSFGQSKGKSKDVHLENIEVSFGSLTILAGAELTLAFGRVLATPMLIRSFANDRAEVWSGWAQRYW